MPAKKIASKTASKKIARSSSSHDGTSKRSSNGSAKRSAGGSAKRSSPQRADALKLLREDHDKVQEMFERYESLRNNKQKAKLAREICDELTVHTTLEEEIFYPAVRELIGDDDLMDEATVEHQSAKDLIAQLEDGSPGDELYDAKVKVLGEYVKHHIKEEQNEMFPKVRKTDLDLVALGEEMQARKEELIAQFA